ncbi:hypothetical protein KFK09_008765 [Dendrobium nobile]|uniref:Uncharacterized protein n=1 Tax=Dendrobium nobile TaxID=94219 RepID=A0A8T3BRT2_DENNO|nr:hypothetical protein KFK09_008765 [Dendrobium nobile]
MSHFGNRNTAEGYSITRPPLFDNIPFDFWKIRMSTFLQSIDYRMWMFVNDGYVAPFKSVNGLKTPIPFNEWSNEDMDLAQLNAKCLNYFFCALKSEDYMRVFTRATSKEIWDRLKPGHLRADCPNLKSQPAKERGDDKDKYKKGKMKTQEAFWADSASESSEEEAEDEVTNLCPMANDNLDQSDQDDGCSHKRPSESMWYLDSGCS